MEEEATAKAGQKRHAPESLSPVSVVTPKDDDIQAGGSAASNIEEDKAGCRSILKRSRACTQCRQAKVKCDGEMPCSRCVQRRKGDQCRSQDGGDVSKGDASLGIGLAQRHLGAARASTCTDRGLAGLGQPWAGSDLFAGQPMDANVLRRVSHSSGDGWPQGLTAPSVSAIHGLSTGSVRTGSEWGTAGKGVGLEEMGGGIGGWLGAHSTGSVAGIGPGSLNAAPCVLRDLIRQCVASSSAAKGNADVNSLLMSSLPAALGAGGNRVSLDMLSTAAGMGSKNGDTMLVGDGRQTAANALGLAFPPLPPHSLSRSPSCPSLLQSRSGSAALTVSYPPSPSRPSSRILSPDLVRLACLSPLQQSGGSWARTSAASSVDSDDASASSTHRASVCAAGDEGICAHSGRSMLEPMEKDEGALEMQEGAAAVITEGRQRNGVVNAQGKEHEFATYSPRGLDHEAARWAAETERVAWIERPIPFLTRQVSRSLTPGACEASRAGSMPEMLGILWQNQGVSPKRAEGIFAKMPHRLQSILKQGLDAAQALLSQKAAQCLPAPHGLEQGTSDAEAAAQAGAGDGGSWSGGAQVGYQRICIDPGSNRWHTCSVNDWTSNLAGLHREEFLARMANNDMGLASTELRQLCAHVSAILVACNLGACAASGVKSGHAWETVHSSQPSYFFSRWTKHYGRRSEDTDQEGILVRSCFTTRLDAAGGIHQVIRTQVMVTPEEYDRAAQVAPQSVEVLAAAVVGPKSGSALLSRQILEDEKIEHMSSTQDGLAQLHKLADIFESLFADVIAASDNVLSFAHAVHDME